MQDQRASSGPDARLVVAALADDTEALVERWDHTPATGAVEFARMHGVVGALATGARRAGLVGPILDLASELTKIAAMQHLARCLELVPLVRSFEDAQIPAVVIKGPALQERAWHDVTRQYTDLDVLVPVAAFERALAIVETGGGSVVDRNWAMLQRELLGQVHCGTPGGGALDLHWHVVNHLSTRRRFRLPTSELFARATKCAIPGGEITVLEPNDALLHAALHAAISGGHRLLWLYDLKRCVERTAIDWDAVRARSKAWATSLPVAAMLARSAATLRCPVPDGVIESLVPRTHLPLIRALSSWEPAGHLPGGGSLGRVVARSLRDTLPHTASATGIAAGALMRRLVERHEFWLDPDDVRHARHPAGGPDGRARYLARLEDTDRFGHDNRATRHEDEKWDAPA
jgi:hypothetical protein